MFKSMFSTTSDAKVLPSIDDGKSPTGKDPNNAQTSDDGQSSKGPNDGQISDDRVLKKCPPCDICRAEPGYINLNWFRCCYCCRRFYCDTCIKNHNLELFPTVYAINKHINGKQTQENFINCKNDQKSERYLKNNTKPLLCGACHTKCLIPSIAVKIKKLKFCVKKLNNSSKNIKKLVVNFPRLCEYLKDSNKSLNLRHNIIKTDQAKCYHCDASLGRLTTMLSSNSCSCCGLYLCKDCSYKTFKDIDLVDQNEKVKQNSAYKSDSNDTDIQANEEQVDTAIDILDGDLQKDADLESMTSLFDPKDDDVELVKDLEIEFSQLFNICSVVPCETKLKKGALICKDCKSNCESYWIFQFSKASNNVLERNMRFFLNKKDEKINAYADINEEIYSKPSNSFMSYLLGAESENVIVLLNEIARRCRVNTTKLHLIYYISKYYELRLKLENCDPGMKEKVCYLQLSDGVMDQKEIADNDKILEEKGEKRIEETVANVGDIASMLDRVGSYCGFAEMMYVIQLAKEKENPIATDWYLNKLVVKNGYKLLYTRTDTTYYPDLKIAAAFALIAREDKKEAVLIVRGTKSNSDWDINFREASIPYKYHYGKSGKAEDFIEGEVHSGMYDSATAILETNNMKIQIFELLKKNYVVTIVGHSLGAGTSAIIIMELKKYLIEMKQFDYMKNLSCIGFGVPPVVSSKIAFKMYSDEHMISIINGEDTICRLNKNAIRNLSANITVLIPYAEAQLAENLKQAANDSLPQWAKSLQTKKEDPKKEENTSESANAVNANELSKLLASIDDPSIINYVVPGTIYHIYQKPGTTKWLMTKGNFNMHTLQRIYPMEMGMRSHLMQSYSINMRSMRLQAQGIRPDTITDRSMKAFHTKDGWVDCNICERKPMRFYSLQTDLDHGRLYRNCTSCGIVVCTLCSPAGEDNINGTKLKDKRISLPTIGILEQAVVCISCYLFCYNK